jgi:hypothetical protein
MSLPRHHTHEAGNTGTLFSGRSSDLGDGKNVSAFFELFQEIPVL